MKKLIVVVVALVMFGGFSSFGQAKIGHVVQTAILDSIPSFQKIKKEGEAIQVKFETKYAELVKEYQDAEQALIAAQDTLDPFEMSLEQNDLRSKYEAIGAWEQYNQTLQTALMSKLEILDGHYRDAIKKVADEMKLDYVLDGDAVMLYVGPNTLDISDKVRKELLIIDKAHPVID